MDDIEMMIGEMSDETNVKINTFLKMVGKWGIDHKVTPREVFQTVTVFFHYCISKKVLTKEHILAALELSDKVRFEPEDCT